jgi:protein gp37
MADHTKIEWTDSTWNIITGCSVVSAGCKHCYAMKLAGTRLQHHPSREGLTLNTAAGPVWNGQVRFNEQWLDQPLRWRRPRRIFVCAHGDLFHEAVPFEWIAAVFGVMSAARRHTFQVLTKRPARALEFFSWLAEQTKPHADWVSQVNEAERFCGEPKGNRGAERDKPECVAVHSHMKVALKRPPTSMYTKPWPLPNVWLGVSVENQKAADERIPLLMQTPAAVRWISAEPLLGPVDLNAVPPPAGVRPVNGASMADISGCLPRWQKYPMRAKLRDGIDWVVAGGESGHGARPMNPDWARAIRDQCAAAGVPFFMKQMTAKAPIPNDLFIRQMPQEQQQ